MGNIKCFYCGDIMEETRLTPVGELPPREKFPSSIYLKHVIGTNWFPKPKECPVADYVIQVGYKA